jgi:DNA mismatch repair protein MutS
MTKTIVKRGVTELVTPGVSMNDEGYSLKQILLAWFIFSNKNIGISFFRCFYRRIS